MSRACIKKMVANEPVASNCTLFGERLDSLSRKELMAAVAMYMRLELNRSIEVAKRARTRERKTWLDSLLGWRA